MKQIRLKIICCCLFCLSLFSGCDDNDIKSETWTLVWSDEFDIDGEPNPLYWTYDLGRGDNGWGNNELQSYTDNTENVVVQDSELRITAIRDGSTFTSARIKTQGLFEQTYGRFEARIKLPYGPGIWPAFWLLGNNIEEVEWPQCGEIDIMEYRGQRTNTVNGSVHGPGYSAGDAITKAYGLRNARFDTDFHIFAVEWGKDYIYFFVDDVLYQEITPGDLTGEWVFDHPFYIVLNVAVGGDYVGFPSDDTPFPQTMVVDYVRVYEAE